MKIKFFGASGEVTGSCYVVEVGNERVMVDCGMFQGEGSHEKNRAELATGELTGVILTHAHLDHCGRLPLLVKHGFKGKVHMTTATKDLIDIVLADSAKIAASNDEGTPIYTAEEVEQLLGMADRVEYKEWTSVGNSFSFRFLDAGHILGSASVEMKIKDGGRTRKVVFSGDLGNDPSPIVREIEQPEEAEVVVVETTYGNREHKPRGEEEELLEKLCVEAVKNGGTVLIPAFSLERTQELLHIFDHLKKDGKISNGLAVMLDSPMAIRATAVFEKHADYFNKTLGKHASKDDPFDFPGLEIIENSRKSKEINSRVGAKVIIAGSGMMSGGRITFHAARWLGDAKTRLVITGYQAKGTLGREISDGAKTVEIMGRQVEVKAKVEEISTMSAHAGRKQLLKWVKGIKGVKKVILTHGEEMGREGLEKGLSGMEIIKPMLGESHEV